MTTPNGPSCGCLVPDLRRRTTVLSKVRTPSSFSVATSTQPVSGDERGCAHLRPRGLELRPAVSCLWVSELPVFAW